MINVMINSTSEYVCFSDYCCYSRNSLIPVRYLRGSFPDKRNKDVQPLIDFLVNLYLAFLHIMNLSSPYCLTGKFNGMFPPAVKPLSHRESAFCLY